MNAIMKKENAQTKSREMIKIEKITNIANMPLLFRGLNDTWCINIFGDSCASQ